MEIEIDVLRKWIDNRLCDLVRSKEDRLQQRQKEFVDGSIDTLLGLRSQFCRGDSIRADDTGRACRSEVVNERRPIDASAPKQAVC